MQLLTRLVLVACVDPRTVHLRLSGEECFLQIKNLSRTESVAVELTSGDRDKYWARFDSEGQHEIPLGYKSARIEKIGAGSPTTVEILSRA